MVLGNEDIGDAGHPFGFDHDLIAYAGFAIMVLSSRFKQRSTYILVETAGIVIVAVYWLLLVQVEAALDDLFYIVLNLSAIWVLRNPRLHNLYYLNYPLLLGASVYLFDAWSDGLAVAGTVVSIVAKKQTDMLKMRVYIAISSAFWGLFGLATMATPQIVVSVAMVLAHLFQVFLLMRARGVSPGDSAVGPTGLATS